MHRVKLIQDPAIREIFHAILLHVYIKMFISVYYNYYIEFRITLI